MFDRLTPFELNLIFIKLEIQFQFEHWLTDIPPLGGFMQRVIQREESNGMGAGPGCAVISNSTHVRLQNTTYFTW